MEIEKCNSAPLLMITPSPAEQRDHIFALMVTVVSLKFIVYMAAAVGKLNLSQAEWLCGCIQSTAAAKASLSVCSY